MLNLLVNGVMLMFAVVAAVTGAFGMNLSAWMPEGTQQSAVRCPKQRHFHSGTLLDWRVSTRRSLIVCQLSFAYPTGQTISLAWRQTGRGLLGLLGL